MLSAVMRVAARSVPLAIGVYLAFAGVAAAGEAVKDWSWLVPMEGPIPVAKPYGLTLHHLPGSIRSFNNAQLRDLKHAVDWFPGEHPTMPAIVSEGHENANACIYPVETADPRIALSLACQPTTLGARLRPSPKDRGNRLLLTPCPCNSWRQPQKA
jgi:hypothetical protein